MKRFANIQLNDKKYQLKCDFSLIQKIESRSGLTITGVANDIHIGRPSITSMAWVLYVSMRHNDIKGPPKDFNDFGDFIAECSPVEVAEAVMEVLNTCVIGSKKLQKPEDNEDDSGASGEITGESEQPGKP